MSGAPRVVREPSFADAIIPVVTLIALVAGGVYLFGLDAVDGPMQVALIFSSMLVTLDSRLGRALQGS